MATFGNTSNTYDNTYTVEGTIVWCKFTMNAENGTGISITAQISADFAHKIKFAIYTRTGTCAGTLLANSVTEEKTTSAAGIQTITANFGATKPLLVSGTQYALAIWAEATTGVCLMTYSYSGGSGICYQTVTYGNFPAFSGYAISSNYKGCVYCTYTPDPVNYTRTLADSMTLSAAISIVATYKRTIADSMNLSTAISTIATYQRTMDKDIPIDYYNTNDDLNLGAVGATWSAQTFTASSTYIIQGIKLKCWRVNGFPGIVTVGICAVDVVTGKPTGNYLTFGTTNGDTLPTGSPYEWRYISLTPLTLTNGTKYAIVTHCPGAGVFAWRYDVTGSTYADGGAFLSYDSGVTWTDTDIGAGHDTMFETYNNPELLLLSESLVRQVTFQRTIDDSMILNDSIITMMAHVRTLYDTVSISESIINWLGIVPYIIITWTGGTLLLHKPYWYGVNANINFSNINISFRSGNYESYIDEINDVRINVMGYENINAMSIFITLGILADIGTELTIANLQSQYDGIYILETIRYEPIGLDTFEYRMTFKFVRN